MCPQDREHKTVFMALLLLMIFARSAREISLRLFRDVFKTFSRLF